MRIGILGSGLMADALGGQWVRAGHEVMVGGRDRLKSADLAGRIGASSGSLLEASAFGEVTLLAVPAEAVSEVLTGGPPGRFAGRTVLDCTNAVIPGDFTLAVPAMAEQVAQLAPDAHVVKAFNLAPDTVWQDAPCTFEGEPLGVPFCGDDEAANEQVAVLIRALGCTPVKAGALVRARLLEATAALAIGLWVDGADTRSLFPPKAAAFGTVHP
ncbi:NAD(P)-binding domain-containing protein [Kribbella sp. NBC_00382]|uniref:NADPH-dependent F420 reductase n=1 Tax=Kribbella sp. NBC_00382 TaxID=2975967 RepID=UPI002E22E2FF